MRPSPKLAGLPPEIAHHVTAPGPPAVRPKSHEWMSDELIADTRRVWSIEYGRVVSEEEAVEILNNVRRLADVLVRAQQEGRQP